MLDGKAFLILYVHDRESPQEDRRTASLLELPCRMTFPPGCRADIAADGTVTVIVPAHTNPNDGPATIHVHEVHRDTHEWHPPSGVPGR